VEEEEEEEEEEDAEAFRGLGRGGSFRVGPFVPALVTP